ncbi:protoporphyrinogen oxidase HemJ [Halorhodospira neutriphila]|uniref:Protoporphyrinogen IX oxidase n=1 Tax=Halorhodospira neutriphila TaxID=168379 RepID=A0ABS1E6W8_9GAMM|nr:TIGR00701 family protein [Halorhodospira neutriphila]
MLYVWLQAFHLISIVTWFAALFYLPRLYVYHAMAEDEISLERFKVMERKLYRGIMNPSAIVAVGLGLTLLALNPAWLTQGWMHVKLALVALLIAYHLYCGRILRTFAEDRNERSHKWYRVFNELPVLVLVPVVILAVVKPF